MSVNEVVYNLNCVAVAVGLTRGKSAHQKNKHEKANLSQGQNNGLRNGSDFKYREDKTFNNANSS